MAEWTHSHYLTDDLIKTVEVSYQPDKDRITLQRGKDVIIINENMGKQLLKILNRYLGKEQKEK